MPLASDQQLLFQDISAKLGGLEGSAALARFMGQVLRSLLRREGDAEFLAAIQDSFIVGMAERGPDEQRALAQELIRVVIEIRPEIALAWQTQHAAAAAAPELRRAADRSPPAAATTTPAVPAVTPRAQAERLMAGYIADTVEQRLQVFRVAAPRFPGIAYCHEQPFFLFSGVFAKVMAGFFSEVLAALCRDSFERHVFAPLEARGPLSPEQVEAYMSARRVEAIHILVERLGRLAARHVAAEAKLAQAKADAEAGITGGKAIEVPVSQPRMMRVLGVSFAVGHKTAMRKVKVKEGAENQIKPAEMEALEAIARLRDMAADSGLDLPVACDFGFLGTLLEFDFRRFAQSVKDLVTAAAAGDRSLLFNRLDAIAKVFPASLVDVALMMLFTQQAEGGFGIQDLHDFSVGARLAEPRSGAVPGRPFIDVELARRPRELAFQLREVLRRRGDEETLATAVQALVTVWQVLPAQRFAAEREAALTALAAFPVAFAGDPDENAFIEIAEVIRQALSAAAPNWERCLLSARAAYFPALKRWKAEAAAPRR